MVPAALASDQKSGLFGGKKALEDENAHLRHALAQLGAVDIAMIRAELDELRAALHTTRSELAAARSELVVVREEQILQEIGIYEYEHPLDHSALYKDQLDKIKAAYKALAKQGDAVASISTWTVNGSEAEGRRMVADTSKLLLRAYNNEADNAVRAMKPHKLQSSVDRLEKARSTISRLGRTMRIEITPTYHRLRIDELRLTADYLAKVAAEKEAEREERERLRDEARAQKEIEAETARLRKEAAHYRTALEAMAANGDAAAQAEAQAKLAEIEAAIAGVEARAANIRAGYVYVISNIGAFGERMVKIGMTRRLEPLDRVRELGDASVPFRYDVHAIVFSDDAVGLEAQLHRAFADRRVNLVNERREFFYVTPTEVKEALATIDGNALLSYDEAPEALEWHQSENIRTMR
jgi:hypothetical protein